MNKTDLVLAFAEEHDLAKGEAEELVDSFLNLIEGAFLDGEDVKISNFGTFLVKTRAERVGTNPSTGKSITIPESKTVTFKISKALKEKL